MRKPRLLDLFCGAGGAARRTGRCGAMGCKWMTKYEARQAIPPVYTEHIGQALMAVLERKAAII